MRDRSSSKTIPLTSIENNAESDQGEYATLVESDDDVIDMPARQWDDVSGSGRCLKSAIAIAVIVAVAVAVGLVTWTVTFWGRPAASNPKKKLEGGEEGGYGYGYGYGGCRDWKGFAVHKKTGKAFSSCKVIKDRNLCGYKDAKDMCCETCGPCNNCDKFEKGFGVAENPLLWSGTTCTQSSNTVFQNHSTTCKALLKVRKEAKGKCADVRRPDEKHCPTYSQYWANVSGGPSTPESSHPASANYRMTSIVVPNTTMPKDGWPFLLHFSFTMPDGTPNAGYNVTSFAGISDQDLFGGDVTYGRPAQQQALRQFIEAGFAVVMLGEYMPDGNFYTREHEYLDKTNATCDPSGKWNMCWNKGDNPDAHYFNAVFDQLAAGKLVPNATFDMDRMGIVGYSVGCSMVSRYFESSSHMKTPSGRQWPVARAGVMVAGGSLDCYNYPWNENVSAIPSDFLPCERPLSVGCCPANKSEPRFDDGVTPYSQHPPVVLLQTTQDGEADSYASDKYFNALNAHGAVAFSVRVPGIRHGWAAPEVPPAVNFLLAYV